MAPSASPASAAKASRSFPVWVLPALVLAAAWGLAVRQLDLEWTINPLYQYGWIVPALTLVLWARAWPGRPPAEKSRWVRLWPAAVVFMVLGAIPLRIISEANPDWRLLDYYFAGQAILLTALLLDGFGGRAWVRYFVFPLLFPLVAVPWPSGPETVVIQGLQRCIAGVGVEGASWMGWRAIQEGSLIILSHGVVGINEACSGIRSLQSSLMCALFLGAYFRLTTGRRWLLVLLALVSAFLLNCVRAFFLMVMMEWHGEAGLLKVHDPAGFGITLISLLLLWGVANWSAGPPLVATSRPAQRTTFQFSRAGMVLLVVVWAGAEIVTQGWYLWHERNSEEAVRWTLHWPPTPPRTGFAEEPIDDVARSYLRYDEGVHGKWHDEQFQWELFFFTWKPDRGSAGLAQSHHPDVCLPAAGYLMKEDLGTEEIEINGVNLPVRRYVFQTPLRNQLLYVFQAVTDDRIWKGANVVPSLVPNGWQRLEAAWAGRRNLGQRSLLIVNEGAGNMETADAAMREQLKSMVAELPEAAHKRSLFRNLRDTQMPELSDGE